MLGVLQKWVSWSWWVHYKHIMMVVLWCLHYDKSVQHVCVMMVLVLAWVYCDGCVISRGVCFFCMGVLWWLTQCETMSLAMLGWVVIGIVISMGVLWWVTHSVISMVVWLGLVCYQWNAVSMGVLSAQMCYVDEFVTCSVDGIFQLVGLGRSSHSSVLVHIFSFPFFLFSFLSWCLFVYQHKAMVAYQRQKCITLNV